MAAGIIDVCTRFGLATVVGEVLPQSCIMAGEAPEPHLMHVAEMMLMLRTAIAGGKVWRGLQPLNPTS